jgi:hypothetical protein
MHKSAIIFLLGFMVILLPVGPSNLSNANAIAEDEYYADQYENNAMDMANDNYYKSQGSDFFKEIKCNNINSNFNGVDDNIGIDDGLFGVGDTSLQGDDDSANGLENGERTSNRNFNVDCINNNDNENNPVGTTQPEPILTVSKEMFICSKPIINRVESPEGFQFFTIDCRGDSGIPNPSSTVWIPWNSCNVNNFCPFFDEADFLIQIDQNPGPNFIRYEFPGKSDGRSVIVESGTYQIKEEVNNPKPCGEDTSYENGSNFITHDTQFPPAIPQGIFCFTLEGDCSGTIHAGEEKACTVKNYLSVGEFAVPQTNGATTIGTATTQSRNVVGLPQSSNLGIPNTFSSSPSSTLINILPNNPT